MRIRVLGSAAGGGFPQWNCSCSNCSGLRGGSLKARPRTQAQVAVSSGPSNWFLLNASPDLRQQILATPELSEETDRKSTRLNSSHDQISYAVFCLKKKKKNKTTRLISSQATVLDDHNRESTKGTRRSSPRSWEARAVSERHVHSRVRPLTELDITY